MDIVADTVEGIVVVVGIVEDNPAVADNLVVGIAADNLVEEVDNEVVVAVDIVEDNLVVVGIAVDTAEGIVADNLVAVVRCMV